MRAPLGLWLKPASLWGGPKLHFCLCSLLSTMLTSASQHPPPGSGASVSAPVTAQGDHVALLRC